MFKIIILLAVFVASDKPPMMRMVPTEQSYLSADACEKARTASEFVVQISKLRNDMVKHFKKQAVSVATDCMRISAPGTGI